MAICVSGWLVRYDKDEAVFKRPLVLRLFWGLILAGCVYIYTFLLFPTFIAVPKEKTVLIETSFVFVIMALLFAVSAGPQETHFDFRRKRYLRRVGFPLLTWTGEGDFSEISHLAVWN